MRSRVGSRAVQERLNAWPGFTDIMVALLLIFVFVVTLFTITETILSRTLSKKDTELGRLQREISLRSEEIDRLKTEVNRLEELFGAQKRKSAGLEELLESVRKELDSALSQVSEKASQLADKEELLTTQKKQLVAALYGLREKTLLLDERERSIETQQRELSKLLSGIKEKSSLLETQGKRVSALSLKLGESDKALVGARKELQEKTASIADLRARIESMNAAMALLNKRIAGYIDEVNRLNRLLAHAGQSEEEQKTKAASLQKEIVSLKSQLDDISKKLAKATAEEESKFRLSQLVGLLGQKDKEIDRLRKLAKYRSEFLAKLERVFKGVKDIKVQGDRFVFQSEILFPSGRADINAGGKVELDKFIAIYKEMASKIPEGLDIIILVQGHTDDVPVSGRYRSNWELSSARAMGVVRYLIAGGIPASHVAAAALAEFHPVEKGTTKEARRLNRRIEIKITTL